LTTFLGERARNVVGKLKTKRKQVLPFSNGLAETKSFTVAAKEYNFFGHKPRFTLFNKILILMPEIVFLKLATFLRFQHIVNRLGMI